MNAQKIMNEQYGNQPPAMDLPSWFKIFITHYSISRYEYITQFINPGKHWLDLGCGDGELCFLNQNKFDRIVGIDISDLRISRLKQSNKLKAHCQLMVHDLNQTLPFENESFDCITTLNTLDWIYDLNQLLKETYRILTPGGRFIVQISNLGFILKRLQLLFGFYPKVSSFSNTEWRRIGWDSNVCHLFTKREFSIFLKRFGFQIEKVTGSGIFHHLRNWHPSLLCGDLIYICKKSSG